MKLNIKGYFDFPPIIKKIKLAKEHVSYRFYKALLSMRYCFFLFLMVCLQAAGQDKATFHISGRVTDNNNAPLSGVSVKAKGTQQGTVTDTGGNFDLNFSAGTTPVVLLSYIGYDTREVKVASNQKLSIVLTQAANTLNDVVVIGYGKQKRTTVTAAVSTVGGDQITKAPVANISNALGGRVSGVISRQASGAPGADNDQIQIRGIGTTGSAVPLVIVNGIPRDYNQLDPNEIETITILKDAAAVARPC